MNIQDFIQQLEAEFEDLEANTLAPTTKFKELEQWNSMQALILIALIDSEYDVLINNQDLQSCHTVQELFNIVQTKKQELV